MAVGQQFAGVAPNSVGVAIADGVNNVELYAIDQSTTALAQTSTSSGAWAFDHSTSGRFDVKITDGENIIWLRARDQFQVTTLQARSLTTAVPAGHFMSTTDEAATLVAVFAGRRATESSGVETAANQANGDIAYIDLELSNNNATPQQFIAARIAWEVTDISDGSEDGQFNFWTMVAGTLTEELHLDATALWPEAAAGLDLGKTGLGFNDLWFESGGIIDFAAGDMTLTHSANTITVAGGTWATAALTATTITGSGILSIDDTTTSTSGTTGSIHTDGGVGIAGILRAEGGIGIGEAPNSTNQIIGIQSNQAALTGMEIGNTDTSGAAQFRVSSSVASGVFMANSSVAIPSGGLGVVNTIGMYTNSVSLDISWGTGTTEQMRLDTGTGVLSVGGNTISDSSGNLTSANGATFGASDATSFTVVNGIITAIS